MEEKLIRDLLSRKQEEDWFDFKGEWKLYQADGKPNDYQRDELIKDVLGMANGNSHIIRKTKYLIVGADDKRFDEKGRRILHNVDYRVPTQKEITDWVKSASEPIVTGIECETITVDDVNLYVVSIPPTFDLHETKRDIKTPSRFGEHTVFMRQGDNTVPASVKEGVTIQQLKHVHRHTIENPSSVWMGGITGAIVAFIFWGAGLGSVKTTTDFSNPIVTIFIVLLGIFFGSVIGSANQVWYAVRYDWPFMTNQKRIKLILIVVGVLLIGYILLWLGYKQ